MFETCHHVMPGGLRCQAPAMRGYAFCYHHARRAASHQGSDAEMRIQLPATLDRKGIAQALRQVLNALANNRITARRASILIYGLQMAIDHPDVAAREPAPGEPSQVDFARLSTEIAAMLAGENASAKSCPNWQGPR